MRYKLIISDYGETIVHTGEDIHNENIKAIKDYQNKCGLFSIATGREWPSIKRKLNKNVIITLASMPIICCYGSLIVISKEERVIFDKSINLDIIIDLVHFFSTNNIPYSLVTMHKTLLRIIFDVSLYVWKKFYNQVKFNSYEEFLIFLKSLIYWDKSFIINNLDLLIKLNNYLNKKYSVNFKQYTNKLGFAEFVSAEGGKESAYIFLKEYYGLEHEEIIVVGDANNDLGLFKNAVNRVAVSNAIEELIATSTYIIDNKDYLGIYRLINKVLKGEVL